MRTDRTICINVYVNGIHTPISTRIYSVKGIFATVTTIRLPFICEDEDLDYLPFWMKADKNG